MTSRQFMQREYMNDNGKERFCSSIYKDEQGILYSYGTHYPLAFHVGGHDFINTAGWSISTAKHINWAFAAVGYHATPVKLNREESSIIARSWTTEDQKLAAIRGALIREQHELQEKLSSKKRTNTRVYESLVVDVASVSGRLQLVKDLV